MNEAFGLNKDVSMISKIIQDRIDNSTPIGVYNIDVPNNEFNIEKVIVKVQKDKHNSGSFIPYETSKNINGKWEVKISLNYQKIKISTIAHEINHAIRYIARGKLAKKHVFNFGDFEIDKVSKVLKIKNKDKKFFTDLSYKLYKLTNEEISSDIAGSVYHVLQSGVLNFSLKSDVLLCKLCLEYDIFEDIKEYEISEDIVYKFINSFYKYRGLYSKENFKGFINIFMTVFFEDIVIKRGQKIDKNVIKSQLLKCQQFIRNQSKKYLKKIHKIVVLSKGQQITNREEAMRYFELMELDDEKILNQVIDHWEENGYPKSVIA
jgi:hypothetical protein